MKYKKIKIWFAKPFSRKMKWLNESEWKDLVEKHIGNGEYCEDPHIYMGLVPIRLSNFWYSIMELTKDIPEDAAFYLALEKIKKFQ